MMDRGPANCGMAWSGRGDVTVTSRGPAEDAGDGGLSNVSTKASQSNCHRPHCSQTAVRVWQMATQPHAAMKTSIENGNNQSLTSSKSFSLSSRWVSDSG